MKSENIFRQTKKKSVHFKNRYNSNFPMEGPKRSLKRRDLFTYWVTDEIVIDSTTMYVKPHLTHVNG